MRLYPIPYSSNDDVLIQVIMGLMIAFRQFEKGLILGTCIFEEPETIGGIDEAVLSAMNQEQRQVKV